MSELIVEMEKPTRCGECKCRHVEFDIDYVAVFCAIKDNEYVEDPDSIPSWCPIVGVLPDEHGDLIDRDELLKRKGNCYDSDGHLLYAVGTGSILQMKTVIAAERKDDGK